MTISGLGPSLPVLQIYAAQKCFQLTDRSVTDVYIGTDPSPFWAQGRENRVALRFSHPTTTGVTLKLQKGEWNVQCIHPKQEELVTLVNGTGKRYELPGAPGFEDMRARVVWDVGWLAEGLNRLLFGSHQEVQVLVPVSDPPPLIVGETAAFVTGYERAHGITIPPGKPFLVIGREQQEGVDYVLNDRHISNVHASVGKDEKGYWVRDLDSTNGTRVGDTRLKRAVKHRVQPGEVIYLADVPIIIRES